MQTMVFTGRLAADPRISDDFGKAIFRLIEKRGVDADGRDRLVGVNCVSWSKGLNEKVVARGLARGCEAIVAGAFVDTTYETREGQSRTAKELVVDRLTVLDWAEGRQAGHGGEPEADADAEPDGEATADPAPRRRSARAA